MWANRDLIVPASEADLKRMSNSEADPAQGGFNR